MEKPQIWVLWSNGAGCSTKWAWNCWAKPGSWPRSTTGRWPPCCWASRGALGRPGHRPRGRSGPGGGAPGLGTLSLAALYPILAQACRERGPPSSFSGLRPWAWNWPPGSRLAWKHRPFRPLSRLAVGRHGRPSATDGPGLGRRSGGHHQVPGPPPPDGHGDARGDEKNKPARRVGQVVNLGGGPGPGRLRSQGPGNAPGGAPSQAPGEGRGGGRGRLRYQRPGKAGSSWKNWRGS